MFLAILDPPGVPLCLLEEDQTPPLEVTTSFLSLLHSLLPRITFKHGIDVFIHQYIDEQSLAL